MKKSFETSSKSEAPIKRWEFDAFSADWPVAGEYPLFVHDLAEATVNALNRWGNVDVLKIGLDASSLQPRILRLPEAIEWFERNGYVKFDKDNLSFVVTDKWKGKFREVVDKSQSL